MTALADDASKKGAAPPATVKSTGSVLPTPLLQTIESEALPHSVRVNDFSTRALLSVKSKEGHVRDFASRVERYSILHPYFLKNGENQITVEYQFDPSLTDPSDGPARIWQLIIQVAETDSSRVDLDNHPERPLVRLQSPGLPRSETMTPKKKLAGTFPWKTKLPVWTWISGVKIKDTPENKQSLYEAYKQFWSNLGALYMRENTLTPDQKSAFQNGVRSSTREFVQACELRGHKHTFLDQLFAVAERRSLNAEDSAPSPPSTPLAKAKKPARPSPPEIMTDTPTHGPDEPSTLSLDGSPPPRLSLRAIPAPGEVKMTVFAGGALAVLTTTEDRPILEFTSNYHDGPWGQGGTTKLSLSLWFRRSTKGAWELDAVYPMTSASLELWNDTIESLNDRLFY